MKIEKRINKLLIALQQKGKIYKLNTFSKWSDKYNKYTISYSLMIGKKFLYENTEKIKYEKIKNINSKIEILKYLIQEFNDGSDENGKE